MRHSGAPPPDLDSLNVLALTNMGIAFSRLGDVSKAIAAYNEAIARKPYDPTAP
ncbi:MAG: tetratricopeptide repeat protein [candidate division KSB1 bacterium]|nr:tetratricopeptide repeat protein [candidate division KSB1 bacterium]